MEFSASFPNFSTNQQMGSVNDLQSIIRTNKQMSYFKHIFCKIETPIKLVLLVRDPRGVMSSRYRMQWCINSANCTDVEVLCQRMRDDINSIKIFSKWSNGMNRIFCVFV